MYRLKKEYKYALGSTIVSSIIYLGLAIVLHLFLNSRGSNPSDLIGGVIFIVSLSFIAFWPVWFGATVVMTAVSVLVMEKKNKKEALGTNLLMTVPISFSVVGIVLAVFFLISFLPLFFG